MAETDKILKVKCRGKSSQPLQLAAGCQARMLMYEGSSQLEAYASNHVMELVPWTVKGSITTYL